MTYNGHRSWAYWNVSLWINNDEGLYNMARDYVRQCKNKRKAAQAMLETLGEHCQSRDKTGAATTPDGARYSAAKILAAMRGM